MGLFKGKRKQRDDPAALDRRTLDALVSAGADLSNVRNVVHYLYVATADEASGAARELESRRFEVRTSEAATGSGWVVVAERREVVNEATVAGNRALFEGLVPGGDYDGWEAELVEA